MATIRSKAQSDDNPLLPLTQIGHRLKIQDESMSLTPDEHPLGLIREVCISNDITVDDLVH